MSDDQEHDKAAQATVLNKLLDAAKTGIFRQMQASNQQGYGAECYMATDDGGRLVLRAYLFYEPGATEAEKAQMN